jgi:cell division initiation protein
MDLSPNDIRSFEFANQMRGYSKEEVDTLLDQVADAMENLKQENLKLSMELDSVKSQLSGLRQFEDTIKSAAIDARRNADMTVENAKKEADLILTKARAETQELFGNRTKKLADLEQQIQDMGMAKKSYLSKLQNLIKSHMAMVDEMDSGDIDQKRTAENIVVTDSSEVERNKLETIGTPGPKATAIITEEAGASQPDDPVMEGSPTGVAEDGAETKPIDPELAAALEHYQAGPTPADAPTAATEAVDKPADGSSEAATATPVKQWVETDRKAEDIPEGFYAKPSPDRPTGDTDKIGVDGVSEQHQSAPEPAGPAPGGDDNAVQNKPPDIADELDNVAKKFAEEMDKAEKS